MGLFDGVSLKSIVRDVTNVVGAFTGAAPIQDKQPQVVVSPQTSPGWIPGQPPTTVDTYDPYTERQNYFGEILPGIIRSLPVFNQSQETKVSGEKTMENGPQVYSGSAAIIPFAREAAKIGRSIFGGGAGGAVGGAVTGYGVGQMFAGGDQCGCPPKPFVRLDKCGRPIITRAMQKKAKEMVQNCGMEAAAQMLGVDIQLLGEIAFKQFKPRAKGISGAQMKTTKRVNRQIMKYSKELKKSCR